jgi:hypothetical protein
MELRTEPAEQVFGLVGIGSQQILSLERELWQSVFGQALQDKL